MSLNHGRPMVAIPGPSVTPDRVLTAMHRPMPDIYAGELVDLTWGLIEELPALARTEGRAFTLISNGHGGWQMALCNTLSRGDRVLVLESGRFAVIWGQMAAATGLQVEVLPGSDRLPVDAAALEERLRNDPGHTIKAVLVVQTDTATSVRNDIAALRGAMDAAGHPALFMVDCIASLACDRFEMDEWGVDITVAGCQKGLMMPPGLGFVWAGPRALAAHAGADLRIGYLDWEARLEPTAIYELFSGTPPIAHLYGLREVLDMIAEEGLENVWHRHEVLAEGVRAAVDRWSAPGGLELNITDPHARSNAVTTIRTGSIHAPEIRRLSECAGVTLGLGVGGFADTAFRIGHMGHLNPPMILGTLATIEAVLIAMDVPLMGSGVSAAAEVVAAELTGRQPAR